MEWITVDTGLSTMLWSNNNDPVEFRLGVERVDEGDPMTEAAARWAAENNDDPNGYEFDAVSPAELRTGLRNLARLFLVELHTDAAEISELAADHPAGPLIDELIELAMARMGDDVRIACAGLPVTMPVDDEWMDEPFSVVLFAAGNEIAVLDVDISY